jgi:hypothetical protein
MVGLFYCCIAVGFTEVWGYGKIGKKIIFCVLSDGKKSGGTGSF